MQRAKYKRRHTRESRERTEMQKRIVRERGRKKKVLCGVYRHVFFNCDFAVLLYSKFLGAQGMCTLLALYGCTQEASGDVTCINPSLSPYSASGRSLLVNVDTPIHLKRGTSEQHSSERLAMLAQRKHGHWMAVLRKLHAEHSSVSNYAVKAFSRKDS